MTAHLTGLKGSIEKIVDRLLPVRLKYSSSGPRETRVGDPRIGFGYPRIAGPSVPPVLLLIEDVERFVAQFREFRPPPCASFHGAVFENVSDDVDFLAAVHLVPDALKDLSKQRS